MSLETPTPALEVEFERDAWTLPAVDAEAPPSGPTSPWQRVGSSLRLTRWVAMAFGAAVLAGLAHRSGLSLEGALCVFFGLLPALWLFGWAAALALGMRRARRIGRDIGESVQEKFSALRTHRELVHLSIANDRLEVTRQAQEEVQRSSHAWSEVQLHRHVQRSLMVTSGAEVFEIPRAAFPDEASFEAFAHALQARIWAHQPSGK